MIERTLEASDQLAVRVTVVLIFGLVGLAGHLHLDILLGGFVAGMITRAALRGQEISAFYSATELPLVVAITTLAIDAGEMKTSTAAGLVGAAMLSTLIFPFIARGLLEEPRPQAQPNEPDLEAA